MTPTPEQIAAAYDQAHRLYNDVTFVDGDKDITAIATVIATARLEGETKGRAQMEAEIERLRKLNATLMGDDETAPRYTTKRLRHEIAQKIAPLEAENKRLRAALEPFAKLAPTYDPPEGDDDDLCWYHRACPTLGDLRRARDTLETLK